ncbi:NTPase [Cyclobacterium lianum]|nr:NTPase [Cyclobacterium lianum]
MKYLCLSGLIMLFSLQSFGQSTTVDFFLNGKSVVLISASGMAAPAMDWKVLAEEIHPALTAGGGDPIAYYELEEVILSGAIKRAYAAYFSQRLVKNIVLLIRKNDGSFYSHIYPFSGNANIIAPGANWTATSSDLDALKTELASIGSGKRSENLLVLEVPEYPPVPGLESGTASTAYIPRAPLNLDAFKLGILLTGASGNEDFLTTFRHDIYGKPEAQVAAEQSAERTGLETIFSEIYPYEVVFLTEAKSNQELIGEGIQFILMKQEGREADLMESMGVPLQGLENPDRIVVKYYIRFLVRNELYIGESWDADPDWKTALRDFLKQVVP